MTVPAAMANDRARTDISGFVDLRTRDRWSGGTTIYEGQQLTTGWHFHDLHEIEYACRGVVEVRTDSGHHLLPPHQAALIPAGLHHRTTLHAGPDARTLAVLLDPALVAEVGDRVRILGVSALLREMMLHAARWPIDRGWSDAAADSFFTALGHVLAEALQDETPLTLPASADPTVTAATDYTRAHLAHVTVGHVAGAVGVSERTLRRLFNSHLGIPWRSYLVRARMLRVMSMLAQPGSSVLETSIAVGFNDVSAFARSFASHCGETPSGYRQRLEVASHLA